MKETLEEFWNNPEPTEGYYAVWIEQGMLDDLGCLLIGVNTGTAKYEEQKGWVKYPEWFEAAREEEVNVMLMFEFAVYPDS